MGWPQSPFLHIVPFSILSTSPVLSLNNLRQCSWPKHYRLYLSCASSIDGVTNFLTQMILYSSTRPGIRTSNLTNERIWREEWNCLFSLFQILRLLKNTFHRKVARLNHLEVIGHQMFCCPVSRANQIFQGKLCPSHSFSQKKLVNHLYWCRSHFNVWCARSKSKVAFPSKFFASKFLTQNLPGHITFCSRTKKLPTAVHKLQLFLLLIWILLSWYHRFIWPCQYNNVKMRGFTPSGNHSL